MKPLFIRFALPWLIFGTAVYALYWNVVYGVSAITFAPIEKIAKPTPAALPAQHPHAISVNSENQVAVTTSKPSNSRAAIAAANNATGETPPATNPVRVPHAPPMASSEDNSSILLALQDADPSTRYRALVDSSAHGLSVPAYTLQQIATSDTDSSVRILAMSKVAQDADLDPSVIRALAEAALRDADSAVRAHAQDLLEQLDQASRANGEMSQLLAQDAPVE